MENRSKKHEESGKKLRKPSKEELEDFVVRLTEIDCEKDYPGQCRNALGQFCILFDTGFCKEAEELRERIERGEE